MKKNIPLLSVALWFVALYAGGLAYPDLLEHFKHREDFVVVSAFFSISFLLISAFVTLYAANEVKLPSFVVAIFLGMATKPLFAPLVADQDVLYIIISLGAALILFGGGLETEFANFKKIFWKIFVLAFPGVLITAVLFTLSVFFVSAVMGITISVTAGVLLGALLSSTDPAAIIPVLQNLKFKNVLVKDIVVSESAMNDVTGSLLTLIFIGIAMGGAALTSMEDWYGRLFSISGGIVLTNQVFYGVVFGVLGFLGLYSLKHIKIMYQKEFHADIVFFVFVPILIFSLSLLFEGSGFLAAFIAGLLFSMSEYLHESTEFYTSVTDGFFKPMIFVLLGALVDFGDLMSYAGIGLLTSFIFIFIIRPFMVFSCLGVFSFFGKNRFNIRELLFISFVRETGAIPAVLLVTISTKGLPGIDGLVPIGMWVILSTLIFQPLLTGWVCRKLEVAE